MVPATPLTVPAPCELLAAGRCGCRASTPPRRASRARPRPPRAGSRRCCARAAPWPARRRASPAAAGRRTRSGVSSSGLVPPSRSQAAVLRCAARSAQRLHRVERVVVVVVQLEQLQPGRGRLLEQRRPGQRVLARVGGGQPEPAHQPRQRRALDEQRPGRDEQRGQDQRLAVVELLGDRERRRQRHHAAHPGPAEHGGVLPRRVPPGLPVPPGPDQQEPGREHPHQPEHDHRDERGQAERDDRRRGVRRCPARRGGSSGPAGRSAGTRRSRAGTGWCASSAARRSASRRSAGPATCGPSSRPATTTASTPEPWISSAAT